MHPACHWVEHITGGQSLSWTLLTLQQLFGGIYNSCKSPHFRLSIIANWREGHASDGIVCLKDYCTLQGVVVKAENIGPPQYWLMQVTWNHSVMCNLFRTQGSPCLSFWRTIWQMTEAGWHKPKRYWQVLVPGCLRPSWSSVRWKRSRWSSSMTRHNPIHSTRASSME